MTNKNENISKKNKFSRRSFKKIAHTILIAFAIVSFWRGVWGLMDLYLYPQNPLVSFLISLILGIVILYFTKNIVNRLV